MAFLSAANPSYSSNGNGDDGGGDDGVADGGGGDGVFVGGGDGGDGAAPLLWLVG